MSRKGVTCCSVWCGLTCLRVPHRYHIGIYASSVMSFCRTSVHNHLLWTVQYALWPTDRLWLFVAIRYSAAFAFVNSCLACCCSQWRMNVPIFSPHSSSFHTCSAAYKFRRIIILLWIKYIDLIILDVLEPLYVSNNKSAHNKLNKLASFLFACQAGKKKLSALRKVNFVLCI